MNEEKSCPVETSKSVMIRNLERAVVNPTIHTEDSSKAVLMTISKSSGIQKEVKTEPHSKRLFEEPSDSTIRIENVDDSGVMEVNFVAEEVVISTEVEQDPSANLYLENQTDNINVGFSRDPSSCVSGGLSICDSRGLSIEDQEKIAISALLDLKNVLLHKSQEIQAKENTLTKNPLLSSNILSTQTTENFVPLLQRQDSYTDNEMILQIPFSDTASVGDESVEDIGNQEHPSFAGDRKLPASRERMEVAIYSHDDDLKTLTPSSDTSLDTISLQSTTTESSPPNSDQALSCFQTPGDESSPHSENGVEDHQDSRMSKVNILKVDPKAKFPPDSISHLVTVDLDTKFNSNQIELNDTYNAADKIFETEPVPVPPVGVGDSPDDGSEMCPCSRCDGNLNTNNLFELRCNKIRCHINKTRMSVELAERKLKDDSLLKWLEDTITTNSTVDFNPGNKFGLMDNTECNNGRREDPNEAAFSRKESPCLEYKTIETERQLHSVEVRGTREHIDGYASISPKLRKALIVESEQTLNVSYENVKDQPVTSAGNNVLTLENQSWKTHDVNDSYTVLSEPPSSMSAVVSNGQKPTKGKKRCKKHCHHFKEKQKLKKELKMLKKLRKLEKGLN